MQDLDNTRRNFTTGAELGPIMLLDSEGYIPPFKSSQVSTLHTNTKYPTFSAWYGSLSTLLLDAGGYIPVLHLKSCLDGPKFSNENALCAVSPSKKGGDDDLRGYEPTRT